MSAPERLVIVWTYADEETIPATVSAHTPKSRDFLAGKPRWQDGERIEYVRADTYAATLARAERAEAERDHLQVERHKHQTRAMKAEALLTEAGETAISAARQVLMDAAENWKGQQFHADYNQNPSAVCFNLEPRISTAILDRIKEVRHE